MVSLRAVLVYDLLMPLLRTKRRYDVAFDGAGLRANVWTAQPPPASPAGVRIEHETLLGRPLYRLRPAARTPQRRLFHVHGGGFVKPITRHHWRLLVDLCKRLDAEVVVPFYPLAPEVGIEAMVTAVEATFDAAMGAGCDTLIGDSAGAYLALRLAQRLRDRELPAAVTNLVLISPCLDLTAGGGGPITRRLMALNRRDPMLDLPVIRRVLALAAAPHAADDPALDPLSAGVGGLPPMLVLGAHRDIAFPDAERLVRAVEVAGGDIEFLEGPGMAHVWPLLPVPEARSARRAIADFILRHAPSPAMGGH